MKKETPMARRVDIRPGAASPERRVTSLEAAAERPRHIDAYIDYFASGDPRPPRIASDACGEALLDGDA